MYHTKKDNVYLSCWLNIGSTVHGISPLNDDCYKRNYRVNFEAKQYVKVFVNEGHRTATTCLPLGAWGRKRMTIFYVFPSQQNKTFHPIR